MADNGAPPQESIRQLLNRRELAAARHRRAMSRQLGLTETEMLAVAHLAQRGELSPSELGELLDLSSGGVSALVQRLKEAKAVTREAHPTDGRRNLVRLAPELVERASLAFHPMVADFDEAEQRTLRRWRHEVILIDDGSSGPRSPSTRWSPSSTARSPTSTRPSSARSAGGSSASPS